MILTITTRKAAAVLIVLVALSLSACTPTQVTAALEAVVDAAEVAVPSISASAHLSPATTAAITKYLSDVNTSAIASTSILAGAAPTPAQKAAAISAEFAMVLAPDLPAGTPQSVITAVAGVTQAVQTFLMQVQTTSAELQFSNPELVSAFAGKHKTPKPRKGDLDRIAKKAAHNLERMKKTG